MKATTYIILFIASLATCPAVAQHEHHTTTAADTTKKSIKQETHALIGENHYTIHYYSPAVRGRVIWGGLVAYNQVWVTGAHRATNMEFTHDITIQGKKLPAGKYALFTIPAKGKWIVIFNKKWDQHLTDEYDAADDVLRIEVKPTKQKRVTERLTYEIKKQSATTAELSMSWEKLQLKFTMVNL